MISKPIIPMSSYQLSLDQTTTARGSPMFLASAIMAHNDWRPLSPKSRELEKITNSHRSTVEYQNNHSLF